MYMNSTFGTLTQPFIKNIYDKKEYLCISINNVSLYEVNKA